jgi:hypothetical protein
MTFGLAYASQKRPRDRGLIQIIIDYLVSFDSLLHSDILNVVVRLIVMAKVCSPVFSFYDIN